MVTELQKRAAQAIVNIFETGSPRGHYGAVTLLAGDAGHLTYGRSQTTLGSGNLHNLLRGYCGRPGARFGADLSPYLPRCAAPDLSLDTDTGFRSLLARAGDDAVMQQEQDSFFDRSYWDQAVNRATADGIKTPLGIAVVYDSTVHGSWTLIRNRTNDTYGTVAAIGEQPWITRYLEVRRAWMAGGAFAYSTVTVFRMDELMSLVKPNNWDLNLPFRIRGLVISEEVIGKPAPPPEPVPSPASGFLIQGTFGQKGNFELVVPHPAGGMVHLTRQNDAPDLPWTAPGRFGEFDGVFASSGLFQSTFSAGSDIGNLEVVGQSGPQVFLYWREDKEPFTWHGPLASFLESVGGNPAMIQGRLAGRRNFELVVPRADGGFSHYWRDNADANLPWAKGSDYAQADGVLEAITLIESTFAVPGTLEVIARHQDGRLLQYWRDASEPFDWHGPVEVPLPGLPAGTAASGIPSFIQSKHGTPGAAGNYELVTPLTTGGIAHLARINEDPNNLQWGPPSVFATDAGQVEAVSLIESNFGTAGLGNLEVCARAGNRTLHYWRQDQPPFEWSSPGVVAVEL
jgi:chitosanase